MKLVLDLPDMVRVVATSDYKSNPLTVLLVGDAEVLYAEGHEPGGLDAGAWEDVFRARLGRIFADLLLGGTGLKNDETWHRESPTGRETRGRDSTAYEVRLAQDPDE